MASVYAAPEKIPTEFGKYVKPSLFLAGSIEQNNAEHWQKRVIEQFKDADDMIILNPRREEWTEDMGRTAMDQQVNWELDALARADAVFMYFSPGTRSPISLLELGMFAGANETGCVLNRMVVCCPDGFWRKDNVRIVCHRAGIPMYSNFDDALERSVKLMRKRAEIF